MEGATQASLPCWRRHGILHANGFNAHPTNLQACEYEWRFAVDACENCTRGGLHRCGPSCFKHDHSGLQRCRHGFEHYVRYSDKGKLYSDSQGNEFISKEPTVLRRKGKYLERTVRIAGHCLRGRGGRIITVQDNPFECSSNPVRLVTGRCNFDLQDMRRVLPEPILPSGPYPHLGPKPHWSMMDNYDHERDQPRPHQKSERACAETARLAAEPESPLVSIMKKLTMPTHPTCIFEIC